ncbi:hypothetical protein Acsp01_64060 [Actinoplanes sp. NBRC 101535]|nr:hypothetical protein Acsp01_64060 [Actinoplanes sp. NBRC 101535]
MVPPATATWDVLSASVAPAKAGDAPASAAADTTAMAAPAVKSRRPDRAWDLRMRGPPTVSTNRISWIGRARSRIKDGGPSRRKRNYSQWFNDQKSQTSSYIRQIAPSGPNIRRTRQSD